MKERDRKGKKEGERDKRKGLKRERRERRRKREENKKICAKYFCEENVNIFYTLQIYYNFRERERETETERVWDVQRDREINRMF